MKILILSWRDIKSPFAGGAETFTYENARRWVESGHEVTWFSSDFGDCSKEEIIDGIKIIRRGSEVTVHYQAFRHYNKLFKGRFDLVIDEINTIPFLTPLYVKEKKIALIFQLAREIWFYETFFPLSVIGFVAESLYLKLYRNTPVITISESTKQDLLNLRFRRELYTVPVGISFEPLREIVQKELRPTLIFVGRLRRSKRVHHIILALKTVRKKIPDIRLRIVGGRGRHRYLKKLEALVRKCNLSDNVTFHGYLEENAKRDLIKRSHVIIITSVREGWGMVVSEGNALSTPAIGYNIHGLRDSIIDGETGILTSKNNPSSLAVTILNFFNNEEFRNKLSENSLREAGKFSWELSARKSLEAISRIFSLKNN